MSVERSDPGRGPARPAWFPGAKAPCASASDDGSAGSSATTRGLRSAVACRALFSRRRVSALAAFAAALFVWSTVGAQPTPWGPAEDASSMTKIERQTKQMVKSLERQRIAWVRGVYLPTEITLAAGETGVRLAGS